MNEDQTIPPHETPPAPTPEPALAAAKPKIKVPLAELNYFTPAEAEALGYVADLPAGL